MHYCVARDENSAGVASTGAGVALSTIVPVTRPRASTPAEQVSVVLYSHDARFRASVLTSVGRRPAPDLPRIEWLECSTSAQVISAVA